MFLGGLERTIGVHEGEYVEIVLVDVCLDSIIRVVLGEELVRNVLIGLFHNSSVSEAPI